MSKPPILATSRLWSHYLQMLAEHFVVHDRTQAQDLERFAALAPQLQAIATGGEFRLGAELMDRMPALRLISVFGVGYDGIDVAAAHARGIAVTHTPDVLTDEVADLAIGLMLAVARRIPQADRFVRADAWPQGGFPLTRKVSGARLGIVGLGRIGQAIASRAQAFGMSIGYTARTRRDDSPYTWYPDATALAGAADFLLVITPGGALTRHLIDARVLAALGPRGFLINVARGSVVDQDALIQALERGAIAGAALDVFADEPHVPQALLACDNVVLTPHMASGTWETRTAMAQLALDNLLAHFAGRPLLTPVRP